MSRPFAFQPQRRFSRARGFTLVELMVAMTGGLFLSIVVFAVSRDASRFYQREIRVANATITGVSGFERLVSDLTRAGHMSTPNIERDPRICGRPDETWPEALRRLRAVTIESGVTTELDSTSEVLSAGYAPDGLVISGALETTEELYSNTIEPIVGSAGFTIAINLLTPSAKRLGLTTGPGSSEGNGKVLQAVFMKGNVGRIVRVRKDGLEQYAVVSSVTATDTVASVKLSDKPGLLFRKGGAANVKCGINDEGGGYSISVVSIVRYNIRSMTTNPDYKYLFDASGRDVPFEDTRAELTRVELDASGTEIPSTLEIVAEYAVDLQLVPWVAGSAANLPSQGVAEAYGSTSTLSQALRGMNVLLSVRSREATAVGSGVSDRNNIQLPTTPPQPNAYARLRTFQSDIPLRNLENANW